MQALDEQEKGGKPGAKVARGATTGAANMNMAEFSGVSSSSREHRVREKSCREHISDSQSKVVETTESDIIVAESTFAESTASEITVA